jgi:hypothetical protein
MIAWVATKNLFHTVLPFNSAAFNPSNRERPGLQLRFILARKFSGKKIYFSSRRFQN